MEEPYCTLSQRMRSAYCKTVSSSYPLRICKILPYAARERGNSTRKSKSLQQQPRNLRASAGAVASRQEGEGRGRRRPPTRRRRICSLLLRRGEDAQAEVLGSGVGGGGQGVVRARRDAEGGRRPAPPDPPPSTLGLAPRRSGPAPRAGEEADAAGPRRGQRRRPSSALLRRPAVPAPPRQGAGEEAVPLSGLESSSAGELHFELEVAPWRDDGGSSRRA
jgi:hypothetical protein